MVDCGSSSMDWDSASLEEVLTKDMEMVYGPLLQRSLSLPKRASTKISDQIASEMLNGKINIKEEPVEQDSQERNLSESALLDWEPRETSIDALPVPKKQKCTNKEEAINGSFDLWEKSRIYKAMLSEMQKMEHTLSSVHGERENITERSRGLVDLLKTVIPDLEHRLSQDFFQSRTSEVGFWVSIQTMAKRCSFEFSDFIKICCPPDINSLLKKLHSAESHIPGLEDHPDNQHNLLPEKIQLPTPNLVTFTSAQQNQSYALTGLVPYESTSYLGVGPIPFDISEKDQHFQLDIKAAHPTNHLEFGTLPAFQCQSYHSLGLANFEAASMNLNSSPSQTRFQDFMMQDRCNNHPSPCEQASKKHTDPYMIGRVNSMTSYPVLHGYPTGARSSGKRHTQRQRRSPMSCHHLIPKLSTAAKWAPTLCDTEVTRQNCSISNKNKHLEMDLQFLLQKELKPSDVGNLGRIVLPKRQAEKNLPQLDTKEGLTLPFEDLQTSQIWNLRFRFWPNNKTRMYLLESTGHFVRSHHLQEGDIVILYKHPATGKYIISGKKVASAEIPSKALKDKQQQQQQLHHPEQLQQHCHLHHHHQQQNQQQQQQKQSLQASPLDKKQYSLQLALSPDDRNQKTTENDRTTSSSNIVEPSDIVEPRPADVLLCTTSTIKIAEGSYVNDLEDPENLIQELSMFEADSRPIDEIIVFKK